jgi:hypothetical protein
VILSQIRLAQKFQGRVGEGGFVLDFQCFDFLVGFFEQNYRGLTKKTWSDSERD